MSQIVKVAGPLVVANGMRDVNLFDVVEVGPHQLIGEVIEMRGEHASIQVYEETAGLGPGDPVISAGHPLSVELGPGLLTTIYDGIQRPLLKIKEQAGGSLPKGIHISALDREKKWKFTPSVQPGDKVVPGDILGTVPESAVITHKILVPPTVSGTVKQIQAGSFTVEEPIVTVELSSGEEITLPMMQRWPVRVPRPIKLKLSPTQPLLTGQRVIDTLFPLAKGGTAAVPGPFGSGKTVVQHQLAKWSDVDLVVYIGCGERGNEMTDVLREFPELVDPKTGKSLMERTVLIANTSDMPVAAREASIYTGITIAEYFRDMGYSVAIMADSTSRWAEALREMSGRLEEMPGEEGYPAYLTSRLAQFYERAGRVQCLGSGLREGTLTAIGAVSPAGGDLSDPVAQATLRIVKVFWGLDAGLAYKRHFPAINWLNSYSLYLDQLQPWLNEHVHPQWSSLRQQAMSLLQEEASLEEIVNLVGYDALGPQDRLTLETARSVREDFLQQNAFDETDTFTSFEKQFGILSLILSTYEEGKEALNHKVKTDDLFALPLRETIARAKYEPEETFLAQVPSALQTLHSSVSALIQKEAQNT